MSGLQGGLMAGRPKIEIDATVFKKMYSLDIKLAIMAQFFSVSAAKIRKTRDELNLSLRNGRVVYDENEFKRLFSENVTYPAMADHFGVSRCSIIEIRKRLNLPARYSLRQKVQNE
jgi:hypothetical protein